LKEIHNSQPSPARNPRDNLERSEACARADNYHPECRKMNAV
jgi:hypothetical protein